MGAQGCGEHIGGDLVVGEFSPVKAPPLFSAYDGWGHSDHETQLSAPLGAVRRVHLALNRVFDVFL